MELDALLHIARQRHAGQQVTSKQLADHLGVTASAVTYLVDRLCQSGHLQRVPDQEDRRRVFLERSDAARDVSQQFFGPLEHRISVALDDYSAADLATFCAMLATLNTSLTAFNDELSSRD